MPKVANFGQFGQTSKMREWQLDYFQNFAKIILSFDKIWKTYAGLLGIFVGFHSYQNYSFLDMRFFINKFLSPTIESSKWVSQTIQNLLPLKNRPQTL